MPYTFALTYADLESLKHHRETQARELFKRILNPTSCLHCLLLHRLMMPFSPVSETLTDTQLIMEEQKYQFFINFGQKNYQ